MSHHETNRSSMGLTPIEISEFHALVLHQSLKLLDFPQAVRTLLEQPNMFSTALFSATNSDHYTSARRQWEVFYRKHFNLCVDFSNVNIPAQRDGFIRLVIVAEGITLNATMAACKECFPTWRYDDDFDGSIVHNDRTAENGAYAVWFGDRIETNITLLERILMELEYFDRTGQHLDLKDVTPCAGSRTARNIVPYCAWDGADFYVDWTRA